MRACIDDGENLTVRDIVGERASARYGNNNGGAGEETSAGGAEAP